MAQPEPSPDAPGVKFRTHLEQGELHLQICEGCGKQVFFPRTICPHCGSSHLKWRQASGKGTVYSTTTVRQRPERGGNYDVSIIELAEGARMMSRVTGIAPEEVSIGMQVEAVIEMEEDGPLVVFKPRGEAK